MMSQLRRFLWPVLAVFLFAVALWILNHALREYHYHDIIRDIGALPPRNVLFALALTLLNYLVLTGYDTLGFEYIQHPLAYSKIAITSFIGYAFSQSLGFPVLTGGSVRFRLYTAWGLSTAEIAQLVAFTSLTFWLGVLTIGGATLLLAPVGIPASVHVYVASTKMIAVLFLAVAAAYMTWSASGSRTFKIHEWEFSPPPLRLSLSQLCISCVDWTLAGAVLYVLLPSMPGVSFAGFLGVFLMSQVLGLLSHVPGGLGVFETSMILLLSPEIPAKTIVGALVAYRVVYYLFPLCLSVLLFGAVEVLRKREGLKRVARFIGQWVPDAAPTFFAMTAFIGGAILIFSGATPAVKGRMQGLELLIPLSLLEISHFLGSLAGVGLLLLARNLQRRVDAAYLLTSVLLGTGIVASLLKGFDYEEATLLTVILVALLPCRKFFYRKASLTSEPFTREWIAAIMLVLISSVWLTFFAFKHVAYSSELWWQFELSKDAPRALRAAVGAFGLAFAFAAIKLLRPAPADPGLPGPEDLAKARAIIADCKSTTASIALLGDKALLFSDTGKSFLTYSVEGRSWVALGNPTGLEEEMSELVWRFHEMCDRHDAWTVFYEVDRHHLPLYLDLGLTLLKLGEEARVPLETFSLKGDSRKTFRHLLNKMTKDGYMFEIVPAENVASMMPAFKEISDAWLAEKNTREKGFSLGFFGEDYLKVFPAGVVRKEGKPLAFINIWLGAEKEELSLDLMRYLPEAPNGVMDFLFLSLMLWGKENGYRWFNLGMAPLSGLQDRAVAPFWNRLGALVYRHGEHFYNFQGLRHYKEKFDPVWEPKYLASPGGLALPRILTNLASLISGGLKGVVAK